MEAQAKGRPGHGSSRLLLGTQPTDHRARDGLLEVFKRDLFAAVGDGDQRRILHTIDDLPQHAFPGLGQEGYLVSAGQVRRSEEHTSELQSLMRISYAVFCL